jgi:predicted aspartyl protease
MLNAKKLMDVLSKAGKGEVVLNLEGCGKPQVTIKSDNGYEGMALADTGASRTVIRPQDVRRMGLKPTNRGIEVKGVGEASAVELEPSNLRINGVMMNVNAIMINNESIPTLVGRPELTRLNQWINLNDMSLEKREEAFNVSDDDDCCLIGDLKDRMIKDDGMVKDETIGVELFNIEEFPKAATK